jgi:hypothetical protein
MIFAASDCKAGLPEIRLRGAQTPTAGNSVPKTSARNKSVIPAKAGTQMVEGEGEARMASTRFHKRVTLFVASFPALCIWVPACAGMTRFFSREALFLPSS